MRISLPLYLPFGLLVAWLGCRATLQMWQEKRSRWDVLCMLALTLIPLAIWLFIQFIPQE